MKQIFSSPGYSFLSFKSFLFSIPLVLLSFFSRAQNCKPEFVFNDKFTKTKLDHYGGKLVKYKVMADKKVDVMMLMVKPIPTDTTLVASVMITEDISTTDAPLLQEYVIQKGDQVFLLLENNAVITLTALMDGTIRKKVVLNYLHFSVSAPCSIDRGIIEVLSKHRISMIRIAMSKSSSYEKKTDNLASQHFQDQMKCMLKTL